MVKVVNPELKYRLQLPPNANWTEWCSIDKPIKEPHILSVQISETIYEGHPEYEKYKKFMEQIKYPEPSK